MNFFFAMLLWFLMAAVLVLGVVLAVKGHFWLLIIGFALFLGALTKEGILHH